MVDRSRVHRALAGLAAVLGALALVVDEADPARGRLSAAREASYVTAVEVARLLRDARDSVRVIDLRARSQFDAYHIPGAERIAVAELSGTTWSREDIVVLYAEDDAAATRGAAAVTAAGVRHARVLRGGLVSWIDQIVRPRLDALPAAALPAEQAARREQLELSRYFGGTPYVSPEVTPRSSRSSEAAAVARILRRGC